MFKKIVSATIVSIFLFAVPAFSADVKKKFTIEEAKTYEPVQEVLDGDISFYWGSQTHPKVIKKYGNFKVNKRANGFGKPKSNACYHALASALVVLQNRADREGGNAVINITSNIKNKKDVISNFSTNSPIYPERMNQYHYDVIPVEKFKKFFAFAYERQQEPYLIYEKKQLDSFISKNGYDPAISSNEETPLSITEEIKTNFTKLKAYQLTISKEEIHKVLEKYKLYLIIKK